MTYDECTEQLRRLHRGFNRSETINSERGAAIFDHYRQHPLGVLRVAVDRALRDSRMPSADQLDQYVEEAAEARRLADVAAANYDSGRFLGGTQQAFSGYADNLLARMYHALIMAMLDGRLTLDDMGVERAKANLEQRYHAGTGEEWIEQLAQLNRAPVLTPEQEEERLAVLRAQVASYMKELPSGEVGDQLALSPSSPAGP